MIPALKRLPLVLIAIALCCFTCLAQGKISVPPTPTAGQANSNEWKEFSSTQGRFSISLPGTPTSKVSEFQTSAGKVENHVFLLKLKDAFYHVSYFDFPNYSEDLEFTRNHLDAGRDGMLARNKGMKLLSERQITIGSFPGREFLILQDNFSFGIIRTFIIHGRLFELGMLVPADVAFRNRQPSPVFQDRTETFNSLARNFFDSLESTDANETLGEVDRLMRELARRREGVLTMVGSGAPPQNPITGGVINGRAVHLVTPTYPAIARPAHASGQVSVKVIIDLDGNVAAAQVVDGNPLLRAAAIKAARESKFTPTMLEGKPVMVLGIIIYNFVAQ